MSQALWTRRVRVSDCLAEVIQWIQSLRARVVMSDHVARAFGAAARAFRKSDGSLGSGSFSFAVGAISSVTMSPGFAPAASRSLRSTLSQWLRWPSGSSVARKGTPLMLPSTVAMPRDGSFALALFGRIRKVQEPALSVAAGRCSLALNRIMCFSWRNAIRYRQGNMTDLPAPALSKRRCFAFAIHFQKCPAIIIAANDYCGLINAK